MSSTPQRVHRVARFGDYTIKVIGGTVLPRLAVVLVTAAGEKEAQLFAVGGFDTESTFERAQLWLEQFTGKNYSVKRIQCSFRLDESEESR